MCDWHCIGGVGVAPPQVVYQDTYLNMYCTPVLGERVSGIGSRTGVPHGGCAINSPGPGPGPATGFWFGYGAQQKPDPLLVTPQNRERP